MEKDHKLYDKGKPVELIELQGEISHDGHRYQIARERVTSGSEYTSIKLYNAGGKFIKRLMIHDECRIQIGRLLIDPNDPSVLGQLIRSCQGKGVWRTVFLEYVASRWDEIAKENIKIKEEGEHAENRRAEIHQPIP